MTAFSFVLLPLTLIGLMRPVWLIRMVLVAGIFEAAAALTLGGLGIQPGLVPALAFLGYIALQLLLGAQYHGRAVVWRMSLPFVLVTGWALVSSFLMPRLFEGQAYVWPQKSTPPFVITSLAPSPTNLNQDLYLLVNTLVMVLVALFLSRSKQKLRLLINSYFVSCYLAAAIGLWQFCSKVAGVPFPDALFYSNPGWAILTGQHIGAVPRINGTFSEPAALGSYMAAAVCSSGWLLLQGNRDRQVRLLFVTGLVGVMLSTSTTGYVTLLIASAGVLAFAVFSGSRALLGRLVTIAVPLVVLIGVCGLVAAAAAPAVLTSIEQVFVATSNKQESSSYQDRTSADMDSLQAMLDTDGLGVGWGSNRSSSLLPGLLAGVGIPGLAGLIWFGAGLTIRVRRARRDGCDPDQRTVIDGCCGALIGFVLGALISAPAISSVSFYVLLALLIGTLARVELDARAGRGRRGGAGRDHLPAADRSLTIASLARLAGAVPSFVVTRRA